MAQLHLFMLNDMLISITISDNHANLVNYLNSKILTQQVAINDVTKLNHIDLVYGENTNMVGVTVSEEITKVNVNGNYGFEIYSIKQNRLLTSTDQQSFIDWRVDNLIPWHGYEITNKVNPYQCGLDDQVHENKGCYTGQEVLTRMRSRNKGMRELYSVDNVEISDDKVTTKGTTNSLAVKRI